MTFRRPSAANASATSRGATGWNSKGVGITGTESIFAKDEALAYDPYVKEIGITEDDIPDVILPQAKSARHGAELLGRGQALRRRPAHRVEVLERRWRAARGRQVRQGELLRLRCDAQFDLLMIDGAGDFKILSNATDEDVTAIQDQAVNLFTFGPALVIDGEPVDDEYIMDRGHSPASAEPDINNPRMCIAQIDKLHYMTLCCAYYGMTVPRFRDLACWISEGKVQNAFTLDGGNSSQMIFLGRKKNNVNPEEERRAVTDILYFASAWFTD